MNERSMQRRTAVFAILLSVFPSLPVAANPDATNMNIKDFLAIVRSPYSEDTWAILRGYIQHQQDRRRPVKIPMDLRFRYTDQTKSVQMQLVFNRHERYFMEQKSKQGQAGFRVIQEVQAENGAIALPDIGIRPGDLGFSFLYWAFLSEDEQERLKGQHCRVVRLGNPKTREQVRLWLSVKYFIPFRVQWFHPKEHAPYRELELTDFKKYDQFWLLTKARLRGKIQGGEDWQWKTIVVFNRNEVQNTKTQVEPDDLFIKEPSPEKVDSVDESTP